jgi:hypothetical protein
VRAGPRVDHTRFDALDAALDALEQRVTALADDAARAPAETQLKRYAPAEQVVARVELSGPERRLSSRHAGIDVHGDGATEAYLGRVRRTRIERRDGDDTLAALRRALLGE